MSNINVQSTKELLYDSLKTIKESVTAADKREYSKSKNVTRQTIWTYFNRGVVNEDLALDMLEFFHRKISERKLKIQNLQKI